MADFWFDSETAKETPAAYPEHQFLYQAQLRAAPVEFAGDAAISWLVGGIVAVKQVQFHPADLYLPGAQPEFVARQIDAEA